MKYHTTGMADAALAIMIGLLIGLTAAQLAKPDQSKAVAAFDHSNCQYPDRWSNPPTGCDNSDPAVPECIKAFNTEQGEKDCIAAFIAQHPVGTEEKQQAIAEHDTAFKPAQPTEAAQCGGK